MGTTGEPSYQVARRQLPSRLWLAIGAALLCLGASVFSVTATAAPKELGTVDWLRDYAAATERSVAEGKPIFVLFQEVPGCQTCVSFGQEVLSHPLVVEAIEDEFIPVAIYNNGRGSDRATLSRFNEPSWNNPVVRLTDSAGVDLIPRKAGVWKTGEIVDRMIRSLEVAGRTVPAYLEPLSAELSPAAVERATFSMHCYWEGEACLGALPGLLSSRTGHLGGREVVELRFDPSMVQYVDILREARERGCTDGVFAHGNQQLVLAREVFGPQARLAEGRAAEASGRNQKFHLKRSGVRSLDGLTPAQATRVNHAVWAKKAPDPWISPRQRTTLSY
jgi:hypothetical protein